MELINNGKQYEFHTDGHIAKVEYILAQDKIYLTHTEVPKALEGKGIGSTLVEAVLKDIEQKELTLIPLCPFVAFYLKKYPEWRKLVLKGINLE